MFCQFRIQFLNATKCLQVVKIPLIIPVASLDFPIVSRLPRRYQLAANAKPSPFFIKWAFFSLANIFVGKFRPIVCILEENTLTNICMNFTGVSGVFLKSIDEPKSCAFIY